MGSVDFVEFALKCFFDFLAWPLLAVGCPMCASIRAIENNSIPDMRNLVAYWILFSLIYLFEIAFVKLIQWLPFWPYMKLLAFCWLVLPRFNGAGYLYENLRAIFVKDFTRPEGEEDQQPLNPEGQGEGFLSGAGDEEPVEVNNGSEEAWEKPMERKDKFVNIAQTEKKAVAAGEFEEKEVEAAVAAGGGKEISEMPASEKAVAAGEVKEKEVAAVAAGGEKEVSEIPAASEKLVQKEWACAMCQVTTTCEENLKSHLQGRKHKEKLEGLKAASYKLATKNKDWACPLCQVTTSSEETLISHLQGRKHQEKREEQKAASKQGTKNKGSSTSTANHEEPKKFASGTNQNKTKKQDEKVDGGNRTGEQNKQKEAKNQNNLLCIICNVKCPGETHMASHLKGKKHLAQVQHLMDCLGGGGHG